MHSAKTSTSHRKGLRKPPSVRRDIGDAGGVSGLLTRTQHCQQSDFPLPPRSLSIICHTACAQAVCVYVHFCDECVLAQLAG